MKPAPPVSKIRFGLDPNQSHPDFARNRKLILAHGHHEVVTGKLISAIDFSRR
jgi:hypothetical protein